MTQTQTNRALQRFLDNGVDWMPFLEKLTAQDAAMLLIDHQTGTMLGVQDIRLDQFRSNVSLSLRPLKLMIFLR